jgi:hypothetical protein
MTKVDKYVIVDGFPDTQLCFVTRTYFERENGMLPVSVIEKDISDRMASTIRHNRRSEEELQASLSRYVKIRLGRNQDDALE